MRLQCSYYSPVLKINVRLLVILPILEEKKPGPLGEYQCLYLLHDCFSGGDEWLRLSCVERFAREYQTALVMPWGENSFFRNMAFGGRYLEYLAGELPAYLSVLFPISSSRDDTFIAGVSMGGYGSFLAALQYPRRYKAAVSLSGILEGPYPKMFPDCYSRILFADGEEPYDTQGDLFALLDTYKGRGKELPMFYSSCGLEDPLLQTAENFVEKARSAGAEIKSENFPGKHNWDYWNARLSAVFTWLPLKHSCPAGTETFPNV
jgi:S-formylglutathione hydrolase FrmB